MTQSEIKSTAAEWRSKGLVLCPRCAAAMPWPEQGARCKACGHDIMMLHGVPVLRGFMAGERLDYLDECSSLPAMDTSKLGIPFIDEALASGKLVLELGAGNDACESPSLMKTDAFLYSKNLDCLADAHKLPFADSTFDYVYSLAVFEHLHSPWVVADEIRRILRPGGSVYVLAAFCQHVHGYPHHYFNMTNAGLSRLFDRFEAVECRESVFTSFSEISVGILGDAYEMAQAVRQATPRTQWRKKLRLLGLLYGMIAVIRRLSLFDKDFKTLPGCREAWRRIAPAFELTARKPSR